MITTISPGTPFVTRDRGGYKCWSVCPDQRAYTGVRRQLAAGDVVHFAVWKQDRLESRKSYVLKSGDAVWVDSGFRTLLDPTKPVMVNRFVGGPVWLRRCS